MCVCVHCQADLRWTSCCYIDHTLSHTHTHTHTHTLEVRVIDWLLIGHVPDRSVQCLWIVSVQACKQLVFKTFFSWKSRLKKCQRLLLKDIGERSNRRTVAGLTSVFMSVYSEPVGPKRFLLVQFNLQEGKQVAKSLLRQNPQLICLRRTVQANTGNVLSVLHEDERVHRRSKTKQGSVLMFCFNCPGRRLRNLLAWSQFLLAPVQTVPIISS